MAKTPEKSKFTFISYCDFGARFFEHAVSVDRIKANFADMAGEESTIGPMPADPLGVVKVVAKTRTGEPQVKQARGNELTFAIALPIDLDLTLEISPKRPKLTLGGLLPDIDIIGDRLDQKLNYRGKVTVNLKLVARAAMPLQVVIDIEQPSAKTVKVDIKADGLLAKLLQQGGILEGEIKKAVAAEVRRELENPKLQSGLVIDVAAQMDDF